MSGNKQQATQQNEDFNEDDFLLDMEDDQFDPDFEDDDDLGDIDGLDGFDEEEDDEDPEGGSSEDEEEDEEEDDDELNFLDKKPKKDDEEEADDDEGFTEKDLEAFNKKLNTDFKSTEELAEFLKKDEGKGEQIKEDDELEKAELEINYFSKFLESENGYYKVSDEELMKKQLETIEIQKDPNISNEDLNEIVKDKLQDLELDGTLKKEARALRATIKAKNDEALGVKTKIENKREEVKLESEKKEKERLQNAFLEINQAGNFFGLDLDKKVISEAYKDAASGKFIEEVMADKKALAELALMYKNKEQIYKKASGLKYSDGMKAILDDYKTKKEAQSVSRAQRRGGSGGSANSMQGLIADILYDKPKEDKS